MYIQSLSLPKLEKLYITYWRIESTLSNAMKLMVGEEWYDCIEMVDDVKLRLNEIENEIIKRSKLN